MSRFLSDAVEIFENASRAGRTGPASDLSIVVDAAGGLRIVTTQGWSAEGLQAHYGANAVYQLTHTPESIQLQARAPGMSCTLRAPRWQPSAARALLGDAVPRYTLGTRQLLS